MTKKDCRKELVEIRKNIVNRQEKDQAIFNNYFKANLNFDTALVFLPTKTEVDITAIIKKLLSKNINVFAPKCYDDDTMEFYKFTDFAELKTGKFGILEPPEKLKYSGEKAVCLVPALGFTLNGDRIGYGKGFYDRFLKESSVITVGLCYNNQICQFIPTDKWDKPVDIIITDTFIKEVTNFDK